jgi:hypothetical protein
LIPTLTAMVASLVKKFRVLCSKYRVQSSKKKSHGVQGPGFRGQEFGRFSCHSCP